MQLFSHWKVIYCNFLLNNPSNYDEANGEVDSKHCVTQTLLKFKQNNM